LLLTLVLTLLIFSLLLLSFSGLGALILLGL